MNSKPTNYPDQGPTSWEVTLLGERFRLKPSANSNSQADDPESERLALESIAWVGRQLAAAEARMATAARSKPKAHHVALLALVELAHEAMMDRNRHARALDGLIEKLEKIKTQRHVPRDSIPSDEVKGIPLEVIAQAEAAWLQDEPALAGAPSAHA